ncbi:hypothetical protein D9758_007543 [Tetrapyrgos nigripes]|uniref:Uncharacterized protein n=1 Tax=Tetrapyrgos nigripes TaxID=182062 RepID=A0A8H5G806_9AGAR|nr:hypothetical protein D9758_007543 [Tetrapyrgos nigripes]
MPSLIHNSELDLSLALLTKKEEQKSLDNVSPDPASYGLHFDDSNFKILVKADSAAPGVDRKDYLRKLETCVSLFKQDAQEEPDLLIIGVPWAPFCFHWLENPSYASTDTKHRYIPSS